MDAKRSVLTTMALADAFGWALTSFELWRFALDPARSGAPQPACREVLMAVDVLVREGVLAERSGYVAFPEHETYIGERLDATRRILGKRRKAARWARRMVRVPHVRGVFAYGSLATGAVKRESDLDVFVVMRNDRIFTGRLLVSAMLEAFGVRRTRTRIRDQVCLNHFVREDALAFPEAFRSPFSAWLWARMFPLAADEELAGEFYQANRWVADFFPNLGVEAKQSEKVSALSRSHSRPFASTAGDWVEKKLGTLQLRRIGRHPLTKAGAGRIVASEREMIFHPGLPEEAVMRRFRDRLRALALLVPSEVEG